MTIADELARGTIIDEIIDKALAPYEGLVPPDTLLVMRLEMLDVFETHPDARRLVDRLVPREPGLQSDELVRGEDGLFHAVPPGDDGKAGRGGR